MEIDVRLLAPLATCLAICVTITLWFLGQRRKSLAYEILWRAPLVNLAGTSKHRVDLHFDGQDVHEAHLVVIRIINNAHLPINPGEYQVPLSISVSAGSKILFADVLETLPPDLPERFKKEYSGSLIEQIQPTKVTLHPVLLNQNEYITVQLIVRDLVGKISLGGHIQGINQIKPLRPGNIWPTLLIQTGALTMAGAMILVEPQIISHFGLEDLLPCVLLFLLGYLLLCVGNYLMRRNISATTGLEAYQ